MKQRRPNIRCGACESRDTKVTQTMSYHYSIARYRKCKACGHNFKTIEVNMKHLPTGPELDFLFHKVAT